MKKVCIIGGSGFVGRAIVRQALAAGHQVRVACRHPEKARALLVTGVTDLCKVDICDCKGLNDALTGMDCVINLVGLLFERGRYTFDAAHLHGTRHVIKACEQANVSRYIHMSALGSSNQSDSEYGRSKYAAETAVRESSLNWTIMRPSVIFGADDDFFNKLELMSRFLPVFPVIAGKTRFQPVWVEDVARAFVKSIENVATIGQQYNLGGPTAYTFNALVGVLLAHKERARFCLPVPDGIAGIMASVLQFLPVPPLTPDQLAMLQADNVVDGDTPFPACFGTPSSVETILPTYINGVQVKRLQQQFNINRKSYRKLP